MSGGPAFDKNGKLIGILTSSRTLSLTSAKGRKQRFKLSYRKAPAKAVAAAPERPASGNQCERIERKAARRRCPKALAPILDNIRKYAVHASLKVPDASRECPA
jgi:hypothetical protein